MADLRSVIWLDDACARPKKQRVGGKEAAVGAPLVIKQTTKTASVASMSSAGSYASRASARSAVSSNCSFAPLAPTAEGQDDDYVRIAIGGL
ncbi:MAG: hypothetical protein CMI29_08410 [Opitutae bacterium]|nr:hypothetical protein [Opitutae bacterium]